MPVTLTQDRRLVLARPNLAATPLEGVIAAARYVEPQGRVCTSPAADLHAQPDAAAEKMTQLLFGEAFEVLEEADGWAFGQARRDRYVGYIPSAALGIQLEPPTHWVSALRTYAFALPNSKTQILALLSMNSLCVVEEVDGRFAKVAGVGWVFLNHLSPIGVYADDPAAIAVQFLGAPYQWGGRESLGLDCSGLVQNALHACGLSCPRDSDQQESELGEAIQSEHLARGDMVFWNGHVGMMLDAERFVHANGHHMAVAIEPLAPAIQRIAAAGAGQPTAFKRLR
jgi:hypothetical protein